MKDYKNSPFLKTYMDEQRNKLDEQLKIMERGQNSEIIKIVFIFIGLMFSMYLDPELLRFIFQIN